MDRSINTVLAISAGWDGGIITTISADLLGLVEQNTNDVYGWLYQNKLLVDESLYNDVNIYGAILTNYQNRVGNMSTKTHISGPERRNLAIELKNLDHEANRYADMIRPRIQSLFDTAIKPD
jgi:hypothetical protein